MSRSLFLFLVVFLSVFLVYPQGVHAKKVLPRQGPTKASVGAKTGGGTKGVAVSVKFKGDRGGIVATFSNLEIAKSVSYTLSYTSRGIQEGAGGTISNLSSGTTTRELLFATCSSGVCRYHTGIKNAKFVATTTLRNGKKVSKVFRLKI